MATILKIKRSTASGTSAPVSLSAGELAISYGTGTSGNNGQRLFVGDHDGNDVLVIGGKYFSDLADHTLGTLTASSAVLVDSNSAIDTMKIGNSTTVGGTLELQEGTNNGSNSVSIKAPNSVASDLTLTLPGTDGSAGQPIVTDGSGNLSFGTITTAINISIKVRPAIFLNFFFTTVLENINFFFFHHLTLKRQLYQKILDQKFHLRCIDNHFCILPTL